MVGNKFTIKTATMNELLSTYLPPKLVAGEGENAQTTVAVGSILLMKLLQLAVVHGGLSSFGGYVDDDHDVAAVRVQLHHVAVDVPGAEGVHVLGLPTTTMTVGQGKWDDIKH